MSHLDRIFVEYLLRNNMTVRAVGKNRFRVESDFIVSPRHWFEVAEDEQVIHHVASDRDEKWFPSLTEFDRFTAYLSLLRSLCEVNLKPNSTQLRKMAKFTKKGRKSMYEVLTMLYHKKVQESLQVAKKVHEVTNHSLPQSMPGS
ncbi:MAG: hypothetical protein WB643_02995 [Candidatus Bathyarchaeia archaeon]